jgi:outer membrane cobalamin receptor
MCARILLILLLNCLFAFGRPSVPEVFSSEPERQKKSPVQLDTVVVTANRPDELPPHERTTASVTTRTRGELPEHISTVSEALDSLTGVDVRSYGGSGARAAVSIRGATPDQVAVYVDGMPVSGGGSGTTGLGSIPLGAVEKIEVYRGSAPGQFGAGAIGGVVHITTLKPRPEPEVDLSATYGSFNTWKQNLQGRYGLGETHALSLSVGRSASDNDFRYHDDRQTPTDPTDDRELTRRNADFEQRHISGQWRWEPASQTTLTTHLIYQDTDRGIPGLRRDPALHARLESDALQGQVHWDYDGLVGLRLWGTTENRFLDDPQDEAGRQGRQKTNTDIDQWGGALAYAPVTGPVLTHVHLEYRQELFTTSDAYDEAPQTPPSRRDYLGTGLEPEIMLLEDRMWLVPRVHFAYIKDKLQKTNNRFSGDTVEAAEAADRSLWTYQMGWRYQPFPALTFRANGGVYTRAPRFNELFGDDGDLVGNADLTEERGTNLDAGLYASLDTFELEFDLAYFYRVTEDMIQRRNYGDTMIYENIASSEVSGFECWLQKTTLNERLRLRIDLTYQRPINTSDDTAFRRDRYYGNDLPYHPRWLFSGTLAVTPVPWASLSWSTRFESESYRGLSNLDSEKLPDRTRHDLAVTLALGHRWECGVEVANLTDEDAVDFWGYPRPGRAYYGTLGLRLP